ncbi:MAG: serine--tRNA ligase [Clostridiales Family XIII bacterium]|jgi:seryl-tRNA synthetase|nr:serine--tRNA ligase [Clostridiales Family XIII bacterium]
MLDIKKIREDYAKVRDGILKRGRGDYGLEDVRRLDEERRGIISEVEKMKNRQNVASKDIPRIKKEGGDAAELLAEMKKLSESIKEMDSRLLEMDEELKTAIMSVPNTPAESCPVGADDSFNVEVSKWGNLRDFDFDPLPHWEIGVDLDILDFERAAKIAGSRFTVYKGAGARLERAVINFMLDLHTGEHGFTEILPTFMVNRDSMTGTGQLPKFEDDMFQIPSRDFFLVPTAEVPVTNLHRDEILDEAELPICYTAYTPCFRKEAGSAGRDTRGLIRQHQFNKVELVKFTRPETSYKELESLLAAAEEVLRRLKIPYRVVQLSTGDIGFSAATTFDIEVWLPSYDRYVEISSCSNFESFQARRAGIRYRNSQTGKLEFVHTLNGSGLAVGRTVAAILENYQQADGSVLIPEVLRGFMGTDTIINTNTNRGIRA